ncbi:HTH domain-containing protein [Sulfuricurvum sp.]|uniref:HTH domain-containing protein n=1 Tax=Sulfuricurvum sp. TaxID=2025608 RepID=UPI003458650B
MLHNQNKHTEGTNETTLDTRILKTVAMLIIDNVPNITGYKIAKELGLNSSTIYRKLNQLTQ